RLIVAAALMSGDVASVLAAIGLGDVLVGPAVPNQAMVLLPGLVLVGTYLACGLYQGRGPSPYERFRVRALGAFAFVAVDLLTAPVRPEVAAVAAVVIVGVIVLLLGYYTEAFVRGLLIQSDLWGATTALVGCDPGNCRLAKRLLAEPEFGLRPLGFLASALDD